MLAIGSPPLIAMLWGWGAICRGEVSSAGCAPCQLMQRVRLQISSSASNSRANATEGNLAASWVSDNPSILMERVAKL